jgi:hypothetical protein
MRLACIYEFKCGYGAVGVREQHRKTANVYAESAKGDAELFFVVNTTGPTAAPMVSRLRRLPSYGDKDNYSRKVYE